MATHEALDNNSTGNSSASSDASRELLEVNETATLNGTLASTTESTNTTSSEMTPFNVSITGQPGSEVNNDTAKNLYDFTRGFLIPLSLSLIIITPVTLLVYFLVDTFAQVRPSLPSVKTPISVGDE
ncbi:hypothetical protein SprV_0200641700 [Sparganum proliferum]